jgi:hypothetical protein
MNRHCIRCLEMSAREYVRVLRNWVTRHNTHHLSHFGRRMQSTLQKELRVFPALRSTASIRIRGISMLAADEAPRCLQAGPRHVDRILSMEPAKAVVFAASCSTMGRPGYAVSEAMDEFHRMRCWWSLWFRDNKRGCLERVSRNGCARRRRLTLWASRGWGCCWTRQKCQHQAIRYIGEAEV